MSAYLSRIRLRADASAQSLARLFLPEDDNRRAGAAHHWLWSLFADGPDRRRDFLWREEAAVGRGHFLTLSARPPDDRHGLFEVETKAFEPALVPGDRLRFRLRASFSLSLPAERGKRGKRVDPVAHALAALPLAALPEAQRPARKIAIQHEVTSRWLLAQGGKAGFRLDQLEEIAADDWRRLPRAGEKPVSFPVLDLDGLLTVEDPAVFLAALTAGFGRARAFGCGLMLIRRA